MTYRRLVPILVAAIVFAGAVAMPGDGNAADRITSVMGIVTAFQGTIVTLAGVNYDLKGVPLLDARTGGAVDPSSLRGKTMEIVFRNNKIESAAVFRTLPQ